VQRLPAAPLLSRPQTFITKGPARKSTARLVRFVFRSDQPQAGFSCKLDNRLASSCRAPKSYSGLKPGKHVFKVWAVDPDGGEDASPATRTFWIQRRP
jgi:hypothetical protein